MEQKLHQVVRDQQDQAQPVEAKGDRTERNSRKAVQQNINQEIYRLHQLLTAHVSRTNSTRDVLKTNADKNYRFTHFRT